MLANEMTKRIFHQREAIPNVPVQDRAKNFGAQIGYAFLRSQIFHAF